MSGLTCSELAGREIPARALPFSILFPVSIMANPEEILAALTLAGTGPGPNLAAACAMMPAGVRDRLRTHLVDAAIAEDMAAGPPGPPGPPAQPSPPAGGDSSGPGDQPGAGAVSAGGKPVKHPLPG